MEGHPDPALHAGAAWTDPFSTDGGQLGLKAL